jgi:hypothetical protein
MDVFELGFFSLFAIGAIALLLFIADRSVKYFKINPVTLPNGIKIACALYILIVSIVGYSLLKGVVESRENLRYERIGENKNESCKGYDILDTRTGKVNRRYL